MKAVRSRRPARALGAALAVGASLALPAAALAAGGNTAVSVKAHVNGSQSALELAVKLSASGHPGNAFAAFRRSRTELGKARAGVIGLLRAAKTPAARAEAARALALLGTLEDANVSKLTALLDDVSGPFQKAVARANLTDTAARDRAIGILQSLLPGLPAVVQGPISSVIGSLMSGNGAQVQSQASLLADAGLTPDVEKLVSQAIGTGLQGQAQSLVGVQSILGAIPDAAQEQLQSALELAKSQTETAFDTVDGVLKTAPVPPAVSSLVTGILDQVQGILNGVFGMFGPAPAAGPTSAPANAPVAGVAPGGSTPDLGGIVKCVFPGGPPAAPSPAGAAPAGLDPSTIAGCLTIGLGVGDPTGIVKCIFPGGARGGATLPAGFDPSAIASCVLKSVPDPMAILKNTPDPTGILKCVFPAGLPDPASLVGGALPAGLDPARIAGCVMGGTRIDPAGIMNCVFPHGAPSAGSPGGGILPAGFDPFKVAGCVMQNVPFIGGAAAGTIPDPSQLVGSMLGGFNPFNLLGGLFGGGNGGGFLGGLLPF